MNSLESLYQSYLGSGLTTGSSSGGMSFATVWSIIAIILAIAGSILIYFLFVRPKSEPKGFVKTMKDFLSFKMCCLEPLLKMFYYAATIYTVLSSFTLLSYGAGYIGMFFQQLLLMPIVYRLIYELGMAIARIAANTDKLAGKK